RSQDFVQSARSVGLPLPSILFKHMLPNGVAPVLVAASFSIAAAILAETTLSFLGLGLVDEPSWGKFLNEELSMGTAEASRIWLASFWKALDRMYGGGNLLP
ncbi:MAG: ABC transporter permease subunit, partial [Phycisphaerales bacterium]|nr:ABC transporter permease subunit [Phycisphaerales bacterium]